MLYSTIDILKHPLINNLYNFADCKFTDVILKAINEISISNSQTTEATKDISDKVLLVTNKVSEVVNHTEEVKESSERLIVLANKFNIS
jgi:methyl-accepting chemotaxis protein